MYTIQTAVRCSTLWNMSILLVLYIFPCVKQSSHTFECFISDSYTLSIGVMFADDAGTYTITATNRFGYVEGSLKLVLEGSYNFETIIFYP